MDGVHGRLRQVAATLLPGQDLGRADVLLGEFHDVVVVPDRAVVKVARGRAAEHLARRTDLLSALADLDLPFAVPRPLGDVVVDDSPGSPVGRHLDAPHAYAGREEWATTMRSVGPDVLERARVWEGILHLESVAAAIDGGGTGMVERRLAAAIAHLREG